MAPARIGKVTARADGEELLPPVPVGEGFAIPAEFNVTASVIGPVELEVSIVVQVSDGRACARQVCVGSEAEGGVNAIVQRATPIREVVAAGVAAALWRVEFLSENRTKLTPADHREDPAARSTILRLVGYLDEVPEFQS